MDTNSYMPVAQNRGRDFCDNIVSVFHPHRLEYAIVVRFLKRAVANARTAEQKHFVVLFRKVVLQIHRAQNSERRAQRVSGDGDAADAVVHKGVQRVADARRFVRVDKACVHPDFGRRVVVRNRLFPEGQIGPPVLRRVRTAECDDQAVSASAYITLYVGFPVVNGEERLHAQRLLLLVGDTGVVKRRHKRVFGQDVFPLFDNGPIAMYAVDGKAF